MKILEEKAGVWRRKQVVRCLRSETRRMLEEVGLLGKRMGFRGGAGVYLVHKEEDAGHAMFFYHYHSLHSTDSLSKFMNSTCWRFSTFGE